MLSLLHIFWNKFLSWIYSMGLLILSHICSSVHSVEWLGNLSHIRSFLSFLFLFNILFMFSIVSTWSFAVKLSHLVLQSNNLLRIAKGVFWGEVSLRNGSFSTTSDFSEQLHMCKSTLQFFLVNHETSMHPIFFHSPHRVIFCLTIFLSSNCTVCLPEYRTCQLFCHPSW